MFFIVDGATADSVASLWIDIFLASQSIKSLFCTRKYLKKEIKTLDMCNRILYNKIKIKQRQYKGVGAPLYLRR